MVLCLLHKTDINEGLGICEECLAEAVSASLANMGAPELVICGKCSRVFLPKQFKAHVKWGRCEGC